MNVPQGMWFHGWGHVLNPGDVIPDEVMARLTPAHPLLVKQSAKAVAASLTSAQAPAAVVEQADAAASVNAAATVTPEDA